MNNVIRLPKKQKRTREALGTEVSAKVLSFPGVEMLVGQGEQESTPHFSPSTNPNQKTVVTIKGSSKTYTMGESEFSAAMLRIFKVQGRHRVNAFDSSTDGNYVSDDLVSLFLEGVLGYLRNTSAARETVFDSDHNAYAYVFLYFRSVVSEVRRGLDAQKRSPSLVVPFSGVKYGGSTGPAFEAGEEITLSIPSKVNGAKNEDSVMRSKLAEMLVLIRRNKMLKRDERLGASSMVLYYQKKLDIYKGSEARFKKYQRRAHWNQPLYKKILREMFLDGLKFEQAQNFELSESIWDAGEVMYVDTKKVA